MLKETTTLECICPFVCVCVWDSVCVCAAGCLCSMECLLMACQPECLLACCLAVNECVFLSGVVFVGFWLGIVVGGQFAVLVFIYYSCLHRYRQHRHRYCGRCWDALQLKGSL